jgi:hypothetical protein
LQSALNTFQNNIDSGNDYPRAAETRKALYCEIQSKPRLICMYGLDIRVENINTGYMSCIAKKNGWRRFLPY